MAAHLKAVTFDPLNNRIVGVHSRVAFSATVFKHRLDICRRACDHAQDFTRGSLLL